MKTTFWLDFTIADYFGKTAVKDTFNRAFKEWRTDHEYLTELAIVLNYKIWQHWELGNQEFAELYDELWRTADCYAYDNLKGDELTYFFNMTD